MSENALQQRETQREDAKAKRISQQNTQQSKLINQRKNNLPPQIFESNEDSLDGFDLAEFSPR
jgi:vacuolar-type H+-ATPase subunit E/Vma4